MTKTSLFSRATRWQQPACFALLASACLACAINSAQATELPTWHDPLSGVEFAQIPGGCIEMGADTPGAIAQEGYQRPPKTDELPRHTVCVDSFWLGRHELTRAQWRNVMGEDSPSRGQDLQPVSHLARTDVRRLLERLNSDARKAHHYRLPTESEWEYACRAGGEEVFAPEFTPELEQSLLATTWYRRPKRMDPEAAAVGTKRPNPWGLYDMLGNVAEWTEDSYNEGAYASHERTNPKFVAEGNRYVLRGGSYKSDWWNVRCSARSYGLANDRLPTAGIRLVRVPSAGKR